MNNQKISSDELLKFEKKLAWVFTSIGTNKLANLLFSNYANIVNEPFLGQHLGIITDRRGDEILTNFEIHREREDYLFNEKYKRIWISFLRKLILGRFYSQYGDSQKPTLINDIPAANFASDILAETTPNSKVIIFVRDGRDVVNHKAATLMPIGKGFQMGLRTFSQENRMDFLEMESKKWKKMTSVLLNLEKNHDKNLVKLIRYEDLCDDSFNKIKEMYSFLKIKIEEHEIEKFNSNLQKNFQISSQKMKLIFWKKNLTKTEQNTIEEIMKEQLEKLNYI